MSKSVIPKRLEFPIAYDPDALPNPKLAQYIRKWMQENGVTNANLIVIEEQNWDMAPMRKFLHGVIIPAYVRKYNETQERPNHKLFDKDIVKDFLKAKFLGWKKNHKYDKWCKPLMLDKRPVDMLDFCTLQDHLMSIQDRPEIVSTAVQSPERYWNFLNACEAYYLAEFNDMYDLRGKPKTPDSENIS